MPVSLASGFNKSIHTMSAGSIALSPAIGNLLRTPRLLESINMLAARRKSQPTDVEAPNAGLNIQ